MLLSNGIDTTDRTGKYGDGMAIVLEQAWMDGGADDEIGDVDSIGHFARFGRRILVTTTDGFVDVLRFDTVEDAIDEMYRIGDEIDDDDDN